MYKRVQKSKTFPYYILGIIVRESKINNNYL